MLMLVFVHGFVFVLVLVWRGEYADGIWLS